MKSLTISRILIVIGFTIGIGDYGQTLSHIGDQKYVLIPEFMADSPIGKYHAWYHAFRELGFELAVMLLVLMFFFANESWRTPKTWITTLILLIGYYAPFWVGTPFVPQLGAPNTPAAIVHIAMAIPPLLALFISKKDFYHRQAAL